MLLAHCPQGTGSVNTEDSDFIASFGKQSVPFEFVKNPNKILRLGKNLRNWENTGLFFIWEAACILL